MDSNVHVGGAARSMALEVTGRATGLVIDKGIDAPLEALQGRMRTILAVMANVLEEGKDYGRIPGTDKPTLYKPGAEKLCLTFALAAVQPVVEDLSDDDQIRYRVNVPIEAPNGRVLAVGIGEASTSEEKYRWRKPVCDDEFLDTSPDMRRTKWMHGKGGAKPYRQAQIRTSPADLANTVLKMAHKRAFVASTLLATGASSVFNQDVEDLAKELQDAVVEADEPKVHRASEKKAAAPTAGGNMTDPRRVKNVRPFSTKAGPSWAVTLDGDPIEYTTRDQKLALDLEGFKDTDHRIRLAFDVNDWQGKQFHNLKSFTVVDDAPPLVPPAAQKAGAPLSSADIPFGK